MCFKFWILPPFFIRQTYARGSEAKDKQTSKKLVDQKWFIFHSFKMKTTKLALQSGAWVRVLRSLKSPKSTVAGTPQSSATMEPSSGSRHGSAILITDHRRALRSQEGSFQYVGRRRLKIQIISWLVDFVAQLESGLQKHVFKKSSL